MSALAQVSLCGQPLWDVHAVTQNTCVPKAPLTLSDGGFNNQEG